MRMKEVHDEAMRKKSMGHINLLVITKTEQRKGMER